MNKNQRIYAAAGGAALVLVLLLAWFIHAPYAALKSVKEAAERRDVPELNRLVDFPALKNSLKMLVMDSVSQEATKRRAPGAGLMAAMAGVFAGPMVEALVTPEAMTVMFSGSLPKRQAAGSPPAEQQTQAKEVDVSRSWGFNTSRVTVRPRGAKEGGLTFVMQRSGLTWRLVGVEKSAAS